MSFKINNVLILGAGTMGQQIGLQSAVSGFNVTIYDINEDFIKKAEERLPKLAKKIAASGRFSREAAEEGIKRIKFTTDPDEAGKNTDIISESVPEDPKLKGKVFAQFNTICPEHTVFTTNSSTLVPSMFADASGRPEKLAALHFHDLQLTNLVDIMPHPKTSEETLEIVRQFTKDIDHYAIELKKEYNGYVFNNMLSTLFATALTLASKGVASYEDVDKAWMGVLKAPIGPFGMMDSVGLETVWKITDFWATTTNDKQSKKNAEFLKEFVDKGLLGIKSRKGFYEYPDADYFKPEFLKGIK
ncbi:MAG: 3-hydroxyacyl-CoA dehydrogenase [Desulforegulaceae bacterium]|nr:3-hydroxyacyl-CoA dehydrogenase [Desulforegulaceae bacterium]